MSGALDFSKRTIPSPAPEDSPASYGKVAVDAPTSQPPSALSLLLGKSKQDDSSGDVSPNTSGPFTFNPPQSPNSSRSQIPATPGFTAPFVPFDPESQRSSSTSTPDSVTASVRTGSVSRNTSSILSPPSSSGGFVFGAGEIGNVSSARYSTSVSREPPTVGSVEARFIVNLPRTPSQANVGSQNPSSSFLSRSLSRLSISRTRSLSVAKNNASSAGAGGSSTNIRRFVDKPWKKDSGSPDDVSIAGSYDSQSSISALAAERGADELVHRNSLAKTYGKLGKTLGEGAGGHVKIVKSSKDSRMYAVKEFRARHATESQRSYSKKVSGEYCLGLTLKHPNIVETLDIIYETEKVYQVMEYCEYDLFAIVMSGKMTREEVFCDFRQFMEGIRYLHDSGLAHRDLKLDNCVVTAQGIVKIIDFGSSVVYKYPESDRTYDAHGVVGSDPYLAPEAATGNRYDPCATDIWSAAVVLCCMLMKKFPWKAPRMSDASFKVFVSEDENGERQGLDKLLASLPDEVGPLIQGMFDLDPLNRWTINRCFEDSWLTGSPHCTIVNGAVVSQPDHQHTRVAFEDAHIAMLERKNRKAKKTDKMW
ncbi:Serine/threonine-protein kinase oca2 [Wickerhamiella sorbophila]|uniref:Serine/threonine-protein kinase oca2 n=1 Tax=Wickerhamiella sorbophila TaxID=45607 RepID=A0A2T0FDX7_9ASCO|nr:Serine/threonine-protein kinase oca2 [Wickerhamiella sorbophila]PRT53165.1 Serine/threonine-protein kinase oca2 [Wickerhamiella sorbophila]